MRVTSACDTINSFYIFFDTTYIQTDPAVVFNGENHIVVWSDCRFTGVYYWIVAARVTQEGVVLDTGVCIGTQNIQSEQCPAIAYDGDRCFAVWFNANEPYGVFGRFINDLAQPEGPLIWIARTDISGNIDPKLAFDQYNYLIVWSDMLSGTSDMNVYGQFVSPAGQLVGDTLSIACSAANERQPDIAFDGQSYLVTWLQGTDSIVGQRIAKDGQLVDMPFCISEDLPYYRYTPSIAAGNANYCIAWVESRNNETDIYGNVDVQTAVHEQQCGDSMKKIPTVFLSQVGIQTLQSGVLYDILGRQIRDHQLEAGIYFLAEDGNNIQKIIIVK